MVLTCSVTHELMPMISSLHYTFLGGWAENPRIKYPVIIVMLSLMRAKILPRPCSVR